MNKINWKQKLTSRKFWAAIVGVSTSLMVLNGTDVDTQLKIVALITSAATAIAYIVGEGLVDSSRNKWDNASEQ